MVLGSIVWGSLRWLFFANSVWMWNFSMVFRCELFLWYCIISIISFMGPNECVSSVRCLAKFEVLLLLY